MITVGLSVHQSLLVPDPADRRRMLDRVSGVGLDYLTVGDHISFHGGTGFDGMVSATSILASNDHLGVVIGVYLLGLRHPMLAARQLATLAQIAPGRLTLGVGVGGEDRTEISNSGVDPATRGKRLDETLQVMQQLLTGEEVTHSGRFFELDNARILPPPAIPIPIIVGGKGESAIERTARYGDGWLGIFCSARRFGETRTKILAAAAELGRAPDAFGVNVWCGLDNDPDVAENLIAERMSAMYRLPREKFQHVAPAGTPKQVADWLSTFVDAGARNITIIPVGCDGDAEIDHAAAVREILIAEHGWAGAKPSAPAAGSPA